MNNFTLMLIVLLAIILCIIFFNDNNNEKILTVGHINDFPPFWYENNDPYTVCHGLDCELSKELAQRMGYTKTIYRYYESFNDLFRALQNKEIDVAINNIWGSERYGEEYLFSIPYYVKGGLGLMYLENKYNKELVDFDYIKNKRVGALKDTYYNYFDKNIDDKTLIRYDNVGDLLNGLLSGEIDFALEQYTLLSMYEKEHGMEEAIEKKLVKPLYASVVSVDTELHNDLNSSILSMWNDGSLLKIKNKYLAEYGIEPSEIFRLIYNRD